MKRHMELWAPYLCSQGLQLPPCSLQLGLGLLPARLNGWVSLRVLHVVYIIKRMHLHMHKGCTCMA